MKDIMHDIKIIIEYLIDLIPGIVMILLDYLIFRMGVERFYSE